MSKRKMKAVMTILAMATLIPAAAWSNPASEGGRRGGPPPEAFTACEGKSAGDTAQFTSRRGDKVEAVCREKDGRLIAVPVRPREHAKGDHGRRLARLAAELKLTDVQRTQVQAIFVSEREKAAPLIDRMEESREKLREAIHSGSANETAIRSLVADQSAIKADLMISRARAWKEIHALLTPEQRELAKKGGPLGFGPEERHRGRKY